MKIHPKQAGVVGELKAQAKLIGLGYDVLVPAVDELPYDLVVLGPREKMIKIQVKSCVKLSPTSRKKTLRIMIRRSGGQRYHPHDVDFFIAVAGDLFYVIPMTKILECNNKTVYLPDNSDLNRWDLLPKPHWFSEAVCEVKVV